MAHYWWICSNCSQKYPVLWTEEGPPWECHCGRPFVRGDEYEEGGEFDALWCHGRPSPCDRRGCPEWASCPSAGGE